MPGNVIKYIRIPDGTTYDVRDDSKIETSLMGAANGVATLGSDGKLPSSQLPSITPAWGDITSKPETATRWPAWGEVTGKPATFYTLPLAANGTRGGVQVGFTTDATNKNYAVQLSGEKMYVNVPWTDHYAWGDITGKPSTGDNRTPVYFNNGTATNCYPMVRHLGNAGKSNMNDVGRMHSSAGMTLLTANTTDNPVNGTTGSDGWHLYWDTNYGDDPNGSNSWVAQIANKAGTDQWWVRSRGGGTITNGTAWASNWRHLVTSAQAGVGGTTTPVYINGNGEAVALGYTIAKSVPSNAVFTDHYAWGDITSKPNGSALTNLGSTTAANVMADNPRPGVTGTLQIANGGTGQTVRKGAFTAIKHSGNTSNPDTALEYGSYRFSGISGSSVPGNDGTNSWGGIENFICGTDEAVPVGGSSTSSWLWQWGYNTKSIEPYVRKSTNGGAFSVWARLLTTNNYNEYAPTKTGTGASGTWAISISGSATKATQDGNGANIASTYLKTGTVFKSKKITKNSSVSLGMGNNTVALAVSYNGNAAAFMGAWLIIGSSGTPSITTLKSASAVTLTANSNGTITVKNTNTSYDASFHIFSLNESAGSISL